MMARYLAELGQVLTQVQCESASGALSLGNGLEQALALIMGQTAQGRKVMFVGNGGSAAIASHQATDFLKNGGMRTLAFNDLTMLTCLSNDLGYEHVFEKQVQMLADPGDVIVRADRGRRVRWCECLNARFHRPASLDSLERHAVDRH